MVCVICKCFWQVEEENKMCSRLKTDVEMLRERFGNEAIIVRYIFLHPVSLVWSRVTYVILIWVVKFFAHLLGISLRVIIIRLQTWLGSCEMNLSKPVFRCLVWVHVCTVCMFLTLRSVHTWTQTRQRKTVWVHICTGLSVRNNYITNFHAQKHGVQNI